MKFQPTDTLPGLPLALFITSCFLAAFILFPLGNFLFKLSYIPWQEWWQILSSSRVLAALRITLLSAFYASIINIFIGFIIAWVLVRYKVPGKRWLDALLDLPLVLPTAVAGITLASLYGPQGLIGHITSRYDIKLAFAPPGIVIALLYIGLPFVVRTLQPILRDSVKEVEEAALTLGASSWQAFINVILPPLFPSIMVGFMLSFARGLGEYGSIIFIAGNIPKISEVISVLITIKLDQYEYHSAMILAGIMLSISFSVLYGLNRLQHRWHY